jgi:hypothetical protein
MLAVPVRIATTAVLATASGVEPLMTSSSLSGAASVAVLGALVAYFLSSRGTRWSGAPLPHGLRAQRIGDGADAGGAGHVPVSSR